MRTAYVFRRVHTCSYEYNNSFMELEYVSFKLYNKCAVKEDSAAWIRQYKVDGMFKVDFHL
jgi:hypothetical protein